MCCKIDCGDCHIPVRTKSKPLAPILKCMNCMSVNWISIKPLNAKRSFPDSITMYHLNGNGSAWM